MNELRKFPLLFAVWLIGLCLSWSTRHALGTDSTNAQRLFQNPTREYSTGPLWVWNDLLTEAQIRDTLRDLAEQKVKQVWVHPRPGLMTPYLSSDWFRLWQIALKEAERLDMNVWIYDENSYPSGFAGGMVPEAMPESRGRGLSLKDCKIPPKWSAETLAIYRVSGTNSENVSAKVRAGDTLPEDKYLIASELHAADSPWHGNRCYVNLLSPGVTEKFLELTMEPYRREFGAQFGKRVPGVFTDEPNIRPAGGFPWSGELPDLFQKRWGYSLMDHLPGLVKPVGDWRRIRHNYFQVLNEQFIERWSKPYHDYCETNHLEWTGHYWDHEWPNCVGVPDNMAMYAWHQRPAIDCLMNQYAENTHAQFGNVRMAKELSSIANQLGMRRTLCEIYGAGGWDLRFEDMKRIGDWLEVLGVNTLNQHLSYVTLRGARKRDHPQSFSYHEPWWKAYHISAEYFARMSAALSQGEQINRILVLEPTTTAWMIQGDEAQLAALGDSFFKLLMSLESSQVEYDLGCEDVLARHGSIAGTVLRVGRRDYSTVVLPPMTDTLDAKTVKLLTDLLASGGSILSCGDIPQRMDGALSEAAQALAKSRGWRRVGPSQLSQELAARDLVIHRSSGDAGILFHHRRQLTDGELLLLVNTSLSASSSGTVQSGLMGAEQWDLYTGECKPAHFSAREGGITLNYDIPPSGSALYFLSKTPRRSAPVLAEKMTVFQPLSAPQVHRLEPNVLTLDYVDVRAGGETKSNMYFYQANQFVWQKNGLERDPWDSAVQFKDELIARTFPPSSGFEARYHFQIAGEVPKGLSIVVERPDLYAVTCNGREVQSDSRDWWLDRAFGRLNISSVARSGDNEVSLRGSPFTMFHELEPAYLLGNFRLRQSEHGFVVVPDEPLTVGSGAGIGSPSANSEAGSNAGWNGQGHPFYSGPVAYSEEFEVAKPTGRYFVSLGKWKGSVAEVSLNGKSMGFIDAPPWEMDVTKHLKRGVNQITVTVIGTLKNTLGPHHGNPALGSAWPNAFQVGPNPGPPPGKSYSTVAYGLFEPFALKQITD